MFYRAKGKEFYVGQLVRFHARAHGSNKHKDENPILTAVILKSRNLLKSADIMVQKTGVIIKNVPYYFISKFEK